MNTSVMYFFIKDRVDTDKVSMKYFSLEYVLPGYFKKPLQGKVFRAFRRVIMGQETISQLKQTLSSTKERIEKANKIPGDYNVNKKSINGQMIKKEKMYGNIVERGSINVKRRNQKLVLTKLS